MKALFTPLLLLSLLAVRPALAHAPVLKQTEPKVALRPTRSAVRPLTRYLAAMLRLSPKQAVEVQQTLRAHPLQTLAPEELTLSLSPVLSLDAQQRLQSLQDNATTYRALYYLTARH